MTEVFVVMVYANIEINTRIPHGGVEHAVDYIQLAHDEDPDWRTARVEIRPSVRTEGDDHKVKIVREFINEDGPLEVTPIPWGSVALGIVIAIVLAVAMAVTIFNPAG